MDRDCCEETAARSKHEKSEFMWKRHATRIPVLCGPICTYNMYGRETDKYKG